MLARHAADAPRDEARTDVDKPWLAETMAGSLDKSVAWKTLVARTSMCWGSYTRLSGRLVLEKGLQCTKP